MVPAITKPFIESLPLARATIERMKIKTIPTIKTSYVF